MSTHCPQAMPAHHARPSRKAITQGRHARPSRKAAHTTSSRHHATGRKKRFTCVQVYPLNPKVTCVRFYAEKVAGAHDQTPLAKEQPFPGVLGTGNQVAFRGNHCLFILHKRYPCEGAESSGAWIHTVNYEPFIKSRLN